MECKFIKDLSKLRKLSSESIDNTDIFNEFKKYMHVERLVEKDLCELLRKLNKDSKKRLVLVCGSAGDGKSHLISYLKNIDSEKLLEGYEVYNDATESDAPNLTSIETLAKRLESYNDDNYLIDDGRKMIIAINLGTLNNFIESEKGKKFSMLKLYVEKSSIFKESLNSKNEDISSVFQYINFSDYQIFTLKENGFGTDYLNSILLKVFNRSENNPFYQSYKENTDCTLCQKCPVRHNYEFLLEQNNREFIIDKIIEIIIKDKVVVSTRDILNFLYDILVYPEFDYNLFCKINNVKYLSEYIKSTFPMLLYEYEGISPLIDSIRNYDFLKERKENLDLEATYFHSVDNIEEIFLKTISNTPYEKINKIEDVSTLGSIKPELKKMIYRFIVRLKGMTENNKGEKLKGRFFEYIKYLYYQNSSNEKELKEIYNITKKAIISWNGYNESGYICIDENNEKYWILEQVDFSPKIKKSEPIINEELAHFSNLLKLKYKKENGKDEEYVNINIDYSLYLMLYSMSEGYRPTIQDKNRHADFESSIQKIIEYGNKYSRVILVPKYSNQKYNKIVFEETDFDFEFKVM